MQYLILIGIFLAVLFTFVIGMKLTWEHEKTVTYEEHLAPAVEKHGFKFVSATTLLIEIRHDEFHRELSVIEALDALDEPDSYSRLVVVEDSRGRRFESTARLMFRGTELVKIEWKPELSELAKS